MRSARRLALIVCVLAAVSGTARAQDRPFLFTVSTTSAKDTPQVTVHYDAGFGERAFDVVEGDQVEQRIGMQASLGRRITLLARAGFSPDGGDTRSSQMAEMLYDVLRGGGSNVAFGMGFRHETDGVNVLTARVAAAHRWTAWRVDGNALFEKPYSDFRDAVDLITTVGVARHVYRALHVGLEAIGEDLEGFWDPNEAEGGARLLIGPSLRIAPASRSWQLSVAGGPVIHATNSASSSTALRSLPSANGQNGYAVRASLGYVF
jgi:hypothetical protein